MIHHHGRQPLHWKKPAFVTAALEVATMPLSSCALVEIGSVFAVETGLAPATAVRRAHWVRIL